MSGESHSVGEKDTKINSTGNTSQTTSEIRQGPRNGDKTTTDACAPDTLQGESNVGEDINGPSMDGGRDAWTQVLASFLINMNVYGLVNAFGDFQHFYETEYLAGYSSSTISWIGTVQGSLTLIVGALAGPVFDKGYFTVTLRGAAFTLVFSWMMLSLSTKYYQVSSFARH